MTDKQLEKWQEEFDKFASGFDQFGSEWEDMGRDEIFKAGFMAGIKSKEERVVPAKNIEKWRQDFIELSRTKMDTSFHNGEFLDKRVESLFAGFCYAKRNQTPIKIPTYDLHHYAPVRNTIESDAVVDFCFNHYAPVRNITAQFDALGIKYEITGL